MPRYNGGGILFLPENLILSDKIWYNLLGVADKSLISATY